CNSRTGLDSPMNSFSKRLALAALILATTPAIRAAPKTGGAEFLQICETAFPRWDANRDGALDFAEVNALVHNPQIRGTEAAAVVLIRSHLHVAEGDDATPGPLNRQQILALAGNPAVAREFSRLERHVHTANHQLFLPGDPKIFSIHQGRLGDCYLIAVIGSMVSRDPAAVRSMIHPLSNGGFEVEFPTGKKVVVPPLTDSELIMGANLDGDSGFWMAVLEKAYALIREEKKNKRDGATLEAEETTARDFLKGGRAPPTIEAWTGHKATRFVIPRAFKGNREKAADALDKLFIKLNSEHRLTTVGTAGKRKIRNLPKGIPHAHVFGVLMYDPEKRMVHLFNPWGNDFTPTGAPGLANGYYTRHGIFDVPLSQFVRFFQAISYETDRPAN
ncbi:MAG TPA: C2 family cysteine protease, partial [Verrucomicrobiae bacterium]|nr:C2 family cysteine protease [Verrucomicrobiae bacterium]